MARFRRRSWLLRALLAVTAVVTVWCLGCSAFEPLISCVERMDMADGSMSVSATAAAGVDAPILALASAADGRPVSDGSCGCVSCHGAFAPVTSICVRSAAWSGVAFTHAAALFGLARVPLVPPPELLL